MPAPPHRLRVLAGAAAVLVLSGCAAEPAASPVPPGATPVPTAAAPVASPAVATEGSSVGAPPAAAPARRRVVVLDPGHNGGNAAHPAAINRPVPDGRGGTKACNTTGTATDAGYPEHAFTFDVARRIRDRLVARGIQVVLTRPDDTGVGPCVDERGRAGEKAGADAVVSVHGDGAGPGDRGFHVAFADPPLNDVQRGPARTLAADLRDGLVAAGFPPSTYVGRDGLSPRVDLAGLNLATRPTALVECANMRNQGEARAVSSPDGRDRYAAAIADGILRFLDG